ncbi:hypothetical protein TIFTF001_023513 [Ficus carica]|nr:hypothetical protein TIFTF001_023513 [Ficus carica]
MCVVACF